MPEIDTCRSSTTMRGGTMTTQTMDKQSISQRLRSLIRSLPRTGITVGELVERVGNDGLLTLTALLTLVFLIPVSIPGVSTVFGAAVLLIAMSRLLRRDLWIPVRVGNKVLRSRKLRPMLRKSLPWLQKIEHVSRPNRIEWLITDGPMERMNDMALVLGAVLLMMPFGLIPFSNTFPAIALLLLTIGLLQRDGVCILLGHVANVVTVVYFGVLFAGGGMAVHQLFA